MLAAAEAVFAEHGFAGARIDQIAARAGLAKSHVYYHFTGKQQIFDTLVLTRVDELLRDKDALLAEYADGPPQAADLAAWVTRAVTELLGRRAAFLRIVLVESLTAAPAGEPSLLVRVLRPLLDDIVRRFTAYGHPVDADMLRSDAIWFGIIPAVLHVVLREELAGALDIPAQRMTDLFVARLADLETVLLGDPAEQTARGT